MDDRHLIYFADPMCSWCYGFWPVVAAIDAAFGETLPIRLVMGGLRPGTTEAMTDEAKGNVLEHWPHVHEAAGQPFNKSVLDREGFVYDTDPAARAVVVIRRERPDLALAYLGAIQKAFYAEGRDVTQGDVLAEILAETVPGADIAAFRANWESEEAANETWTDSAISQRAGVTGFPTLVGGPDERGQFGVVTRGYAPPEQVLPILADWAGRPAQ